MDVMRTFSNRVPVAFLGIILLVARWAHGSPMGQAAVDQVSEANYRYYLGDAVSEPGILYTHNGNSRGLGDPEHDLAQANIIAEFESFGLTVVEEEFTYAGGTYSNVVATMIGTTYPDQQYIIGSHFDSTCSCSWAPGADDNASGISLILETASILSQYDSQSTIKFIAFDREEQGLYGSTAYVSAHDGEDIRAMISIDMVAYDPGTENALLRGRDTPALPLKTALRQAVATYSEYQGITLASTDGGWNGQSDHAPFDSAGYQAVLFIEGEGWSNPNIHSTADSVDTPGYINYPYAVRMVKSIVGYMVDSAGVIIYVHNGDSDFDGLVTLADHAEFQDCMFGPGVLPAPALPLSEQKCLGIFDFDLDSDVDAADFADFSTVFGAGDCNGNGVADETDLTAGTSQDCNTNSVPDECDLAAGTSEDCQTDGIPDECQLEVSAEAQDLCVDAQPVCTGIAYTGSTSGASSDGSSSCGSSNSSPDVWYSYTPSLGGSATFSLCDGTSYDAVLSVHTVCPGASGTDVGCDDDGCGSTGGPSTVTRSVSAGTTYLIRVNGWNGSSGSFTLSITGPNCELLAGGDCNLNDVPDECDIDSGLSDDINLNGIPDECEP